MGDTVKINMIGDITISNYSKDTDLASPQALTDAQAQLTITQAKYFNFEIDDVDQAQTANDGAIMQEAMSWAAYRLKDTIDQYLAGFYVDAAAGNALNGGAAVTTLVAPTQANVGGGLTVYDTIVKLGQLLTQNAVPIQGRWIVIPPWGKTQLTMDVRFSGFKTPSAPQTLQTSTLTAPDTHPSDSYLGKIENMNVYESLNAPQDRKSTRLNSSHQIISDPVFFL